MSVIGFDEDADVGISLPDGWRVVVVEFESVVEEPDQGLIAVAVGESGESGELYHETIPCPEGGSEGSGTIRTTVCFAMRDADLASAELVVMGAVDETAFLAVR